VYQLGEVFRPDLLPGAALKAAAATATPPLERRRVVLDSATPGWLVPVVVGAGVLLLVLRR